MGSALLAMAKADIALQEALAREGSLYGGYHPRMRALHEANAAELARVIRESGWPDAGRFGAEAAEAAWLIVQHAISRPDLMRQGLLLLTEAVEAGRAPAWQMAYLSDRIAVFEGRPQLFGTSFDWGDDGRLSPCPLADSERVDELRQSVGLPPLSVETARHRATAEPCPADLAAYRRAQEAFARSCGWR
ncbi:MAG: hypothetical protein HXY22_09735 [Alphaproteobacteria bacterium]|nr:hypothetical protein [Alphaproteobacteria bacterium]